VIDMADELGEARAEAERLREGIRSLGVAYSFQVRVWFEDRDVMKHENRRLHAEAKGAEGVELRGFERGVRAAAGVVDGSAIAGRTAEIVVQHVLALLGDEQVPE
jgi:hypothetical protein